MRVRQTLTSQTFHFLPELFPALNCFKAEILINKNVATFQFLYVLKYFLFLLVRQRLTNNNSWFTAARLSFWGMCSLYINVFEVQLFLKNIINFFFTLPLSFTSFQQHHQSVGWIFWIYLLSLLVSYRRIQYLFDYRKTLVVLSTCFHIVLQVFLPSLLARSRWIRDCYSDHIFLFPRLSIWSC